VWSSFGNWNFLKHFQWQEPGDDDEWSLSHQIVASSLKHIAESIDHRCCKRDTYLSLQAAAEFLKDKYAIDLPLSEARCTFSLRNQNLREEECNFYNLSYSLV